MKFAHPETKQCI